MNGEINSVFTGRFYMNTIAYGIVFYLNFFWLVPRLFLRGKRISYFVSAATIIVCLYFILEFSIVNFFHERERELKMFEMPPNASEKNHIPAKQPMFTPPYFFGPDSMVMADKFNDDARFRKFGKPPNRQFHIFNYLFTAIMISGFSVGLRVSDKLTKNEKQRKELEKEKLNSELTFLKNQISPHFFFNTLNNIYSLIGINSEDSKIAVHKLSKLMRYLLYETEQAEILLSHEIDFMSNYIDLMRLRMNEKVELIVSFPSNYNDFPIAPLLFIPFIENAFKHGISYRDKSVIEISMEVTDENIVFQCKNSMGKTPEEQVSEYSGIGVENVRKRLNLLLPEMHQLTIDKSDKYFNVYLSISKNKS
jgi:hypothetical protein